MQITDAMVTAALSQLHSTAAITRAEITAALTAALSLVEQPVDGERQKPIAHLVWLQGLRAADDVVDYYEVARPGDKCVDGSDPFPVYASPLRDQAVGERGLASFTEYFVRNYPGPDTVIFDPKWHAPKLFRAAVSAYLSASPPTPVVDAAREGETGPQETLTVNEALMESQYRAGIKAGWNAAQADDPNAALAALTRYDGYLKPITDKRRATLSTDADGKEG